LHLVKLGRFSKFGFSVYSCPMIFGLYPMIFAATASTYIKLNSKATLSGASVFARQHLVSVTGITNIGVLFKP
jgi:hypothetical protein